MEAHFSKCRDFKSQQTISILKFNYAGNHKRVHEVKKMVNVQKVGEVYRCEVCGNVVEVKEVGGGELVCCGQPMTLISSP